MKQQELYDDGDMDIPIMLSKPSSASKETARNLNTLTEQADDETLRTSYVNPNIQRVAIEDVPNVEEPSNVSLNIADQNLEKEEGIENGRNVITTRRKWDAINQNKATKITAPLKKQMETSALRNQNTAAESCSAPSQLMPSEGGGRTENTNIHFEGVTTVISHKSFDGERRGSFNLSEGNESGSNGSGDFESNTKFMKVVAQTVYIHNHFYKN